MKTLKIILKWWFGISFTCLGIMSITLTPISGILLIFIGLIVIPDTLKIIERQLKHILPSIIKWGIMMLGLFLIGMVTKKNKGFDHEYNNTKIANYEIVVEEVHESKNKALLREYVVYKDSFYSEESLKNVLLDVYRKNKDKHLFENYSSATVFAAYVFTSEEKAKSEKASWLGMLSKLPSDEEPVFSFDNSKIEALQGLNDNKKSEDEIALDNLKTILKERNLELCKLYNDLGDMELECIHRADAKYPDFGLKHSEYSQKLIGIEMNKLKKKYNLADSVFTYVSVFGMTYCK